MVDQFDVTLNDPVLLEEVELCAELIVAANASDSALSPETIDLILGVRPGDGDPTHVPGGMPPPWQG